MDAVTTTTRPATLTAVQLAAGGVSMTITSAGLTNPRVTIVSPKERPDLKAAFNAALEWRVTAMRAQHREQQRKPTGALGEVLPNRHATLVAVAGLVLPMTPPVRLRYSKENSSGGLSYVTAECSRPQPGLCPSCGDEHAQRRDTGDCALCNAARVVALRAEGVLAQSEPRVAQAPLTMDEFRREHMSHAARPDPNPPPAGVKPWVCKCGAKVTNYTDPDNECGACYLKRIAVCDTRWLGGRPKTEGGRTKGMAR